MDSKKMKSDKDVMGPSSNKNRKQSVGSSSSSSSVKLNRPLLSSAPRELTEGREIDYDLDVAVLKEMHSFFIQSGMKLGALVSSWTNKVLFFKHWVNKYRQQCDSRDLFLKIDKWREVWQSGAYSIYDPSYYPMLLDLWGTCDRDKGAKDYIEGLTNNNVDENRMEQGSKDICLLKKMHKYFHKENKGISTEPVKSSKNRTKFYMEALMGKDNGEEKDRNSSEDEETAFEGFLRIPELYDLFRNFKVDNTTSRIDLEVFYWGFLVWGTDYNGGEFYDIEDDDDDTEGEGEGKGEGG